MNRQTAGSRAAAVSVVFLALLPLIPLWAYTFVPMQDYGNHLARMIILENIDKSRIFQEYFSIHYIRGGVPLPNMALDLFVQALAPVLNPDHAMRLFISLYALMYILSIKLLADLEGRDFTLLMLLNLPLVYSAFFVMGFLNFLFSIPLFLICLWFFLRFERSGSVKYAVLLGLGACAVYVSHIVGLFAICIFVMVRAASRPRDYRRYILAALPLALPAALAVKYSLVSSGTYVMKMSRPALKALMLLSPFLHTPEPYIIVNTMLYFFALYLVVRNLKMERSYLLAALVFLALYALLPFQGMNGSYIDARMLMFGFIMLSVSFVPRSAYAIKAAKILVAAVVISGYAWMSYLYWSFNRDFSTECASRIKKDSVVFTVDATWLNGFSAPYLHAWGYFYEEKEFVGPYIFTGLTQPLEYTRLLPTPYEYRIIAGKKEENPVDWDEIGHAYDQVLLMGGDAETEKGIDGISTETCSSGLVRLYNVNKQTEGREQQ